MNLFTVRLFSFIVTVLATTPVLFTRRKAQPPWHAYRGYLLVLAVGRNPVFVAEHPGLDEVKGHPVVAHVVEDQTQGPPWPLCSNSEEAHSNPPHLHSSMVMVGNRHESKYVFFCNRAASITLQRIYQVQWARVKSMVRDHT